MNDLISEYVQQFFGYGGTTTAKVWFVGLEEAGGKDPWDELVSRSTWWKDRALKEPICDLYGFHYEPGSETRPHSPTWSGIIRMIRAWKNQENLQIEPTGQFMKNCLARSGSDHALLELSPIARSSSSSNASHVWKRLKDEPFNIAESEILDVRLRKFAELYEKYEPKVIVFYGKAPERQSVFCKQIGCQYPGYDQAKPLLSDQGRSRIISVVHPTARVKRVSSLNKAGLLIAEGIRRH